MLITDLGFEFVISFYVCLYTIKIIAIRDFKQTEDIPCVLSCETDVGSSSIILYQTFWVF